MRNLKFLAKSVTALMAILAQDFALANSTIQITPTEIKSCQNIYPVLINSFENSPNQSGQILGDLKSVLEKPIVRQCAGTCYFEASVSAAESALTKFWGSPKFISRPLLFYELILNQLSKLEKLKSLDSTSGNESQQPEIFNLATNKIDIVSAGGAMFVSNLIALKPIYVVSTKNQNYINKETAFIQKMYDFVGNKLTDWLVPELKSIDLNTNNLSESTKLEKIKRALQKNDFSLSDDQKNQIRLGLQSILREFIYELKDIESRSSTDGHIDPAGQSIDSTHVNDPKNTTQGQIGLSQLVKENFFKEVVMAKTFSKKLNFDSQYLSPSLEELIIGSLQSGKELFLSYFHIRNYVRKLNDRKGFLMLTPAEQSQPIPPDQAIKNKLGNYHAVVIVDVIKNKAGRIEYLVVRNSFGDHALTDNGYNYIHVNYLAQYGANIVDWVIALRKEFKPSDF